MVKKLNFSAQVAAIVAKNEKKLDALVRESVQELVIEANTPTAQGGNMRVDTSFLRKSGQMSLSGMPSGPSRKEDGFGFDNVTATLAGFAGGDSIFYGWTASYAKYREAHDGFLRLAVQNWQTIVDKVAAQLRDQ